MVNKTNNQEVIQTAKTEMKKYGILDKLNQLGKPLFLTVSGAHSFGFPSPDSDYDIRGVYQAKTKSLLGLEKVQPTAFEYMSDDKKLDVSIDELGHYLRVLSKSNGNRLEWPSSQLIFYKSPEFEDLKQVVTDNVLSKSLLPHYLNFARDMWNGRTREKGVKKDLYTLRIYMAGINIFENNEVNSNINELNKDFKQRIIGQMIRVKERGELAKAHGYDRQKLEQLVGELDARLLQAVENSNLPEKPNLYEIEKFLTDLRL